MKKNTNWKGGGHNGTSIYCCLIMAAGTVRTHKKANWHLVVHSHTPWIMKQNTTNHTTNTFYKTPNRSIKYFRILRLLQQLLQLNPYIDKRLIIECILQVYVGVTINVSSSISSSDSRQTLIYKKSVL